MGGGRDVQDKLYRAADIDQSGEVSLKEFTSVVIDFACRGNAVIHEVPDCTSVTNVHAMLVKNRIISCEDENLDGGRDDDEEEDSEEEDEEEEVPEDLVDSDPRKQQTWILLRSFKMMAFGTILVLAFSDPMVDVLAGIGQRIQLDPFYVAFVIAPIASNAGELVAAYNYAVKKSQKSITISLTTLQGAACMNNTFCLSIFLGLVWYRELPWKFGAETIAIVTVELALAFYSYFWKVERMIDSVLILMLYPFSLYLVSSLKAII